MGSIAPCAELPGRTGGGRDIWPELYDDGSGSCGHFLYDGVSSEPEATSAVWTCCRACWGLRRGKLVWQRKGEWAIGKLDDGNYAASADDDGMTAKANFLRAVVTLKHEGIGDYMPPEGRLMIEIWAERADVRATLVGCVKGRPVLRSKRTPRFTTPGTCERK
jgi:hypothetical protein